MKKLVAKIGTYMKDGQQKGRYMNVGVMLSNNNGEYMLLDPCVDLSGVLAKQNAMSAAEGKPFRDSVAVSIFEESSNPGAQPSNNNQGFGQAPQNQGFNQNQPQAGQNFGDDFDPFAQ